MPASKNPSVIEIAERHTLESRMACSEAANSRTRVRFRHAPNVHQGTRHVILTCSQQALDRLKVELRVPLRSTSQIIVTASREWRAKQRCKFLGNLPGFWGGICRFVGGFDRSWTCFRGIWI